MLQPCLRPYLAVILLHFLEIATRVQLVKNKPDVRTYLQIGSERY